MTHCPPPSPALRDDIRSAVEACEKAVRTRFSFIERIPQAPRTREEWFDLVGRLPPRRGGLPRLRRIQREAATAGIGLAPRVVEQCALINAALVAARRIGALRVDESVKHQFCWIFRQVADTPPALQPFLDADTWGYQEVAQIVTLQRYPAGQHNWVIARAGRKALLKFRLELHEVPRVVREVIVGYGGFAPVAGIHLNIWRARPHLVLKSETCRAMYRLARSLELQPHIRGIQGLSWLHSKEVAEVSPHLAWLRDFFVENGAFTADMGPAAPESGFDVGSTRRRQMFNEGRWRPRMTLVLWRRRDALAWAARHPELADGAVGAELRGEAHASRIRPVASQLVAQQPAF